MGIFDIFFKKRERNIMDQSVQVIKQPKQGFFTEKEYIYPNSAYTRPNPEFLMTLSGEYENDVREGRWIIEDKYGRKGYINYEEGRKHGLEMTPDGTYSLYYQGQRIKMHYDFLMTNDELFHIYELLKVKKLILHITLKLIQYNKYLLYF